MTFAYTWYEIFAYFLIYSFLGWCTEVVYAAVSTGELVNRGFLNGPVCPIYGFGMLAVLACLTPLQDSAAVMFLGGMALTTFIELAGGWVLYKAFHTRWWDYSDKPFNLGGYICLEFSLLWGLGTVIIMRVVHPFIAALVAPIPHKVGWVVMALLYALYAADLVVTLFVVAGLRRDLEALEKVAGSLHEVSDALTDLLGTTALSTDQKLDEGRLQLTLARAEASDKAAEMRDAAGNTMREVKAETRIAMAGLADRAVRSVLNTVNDAAERAAAAAEDANRKTEEARASFAQARAAYEGSVASRRAELEQRRAELEQHAEALRRDVLQRKLFGGARLLRAFPGMVNHRHRDTLEELKQRLPGRKTGKK